MKTRIILALIITALFSTAANATTIPEFLKLSDHDQAIYLYGAASMLPFSEGIQDQKVDRAECVAQWYAGPGKKAISDALHLPPVLFKARFGFAADSQEYGFVDYVILLLAKDACPAK